MMSDNDLRYFQRRAQEERAAADEASDPCARKAHEDIADAYERRTKTTGTPKHGTAA
jgi:hypothetical protein